MLQVVNESVWDRERRSFIESALSAAESLSATINAALVYVNTISIFLKTS